MTIRKNSLKGLTPMAGILMLALLTSCSTAGAGAADSEGVAFGASKQEYMDAFQGVDTITLQTQTGGTEGNAANRGREAYMDAVTEWSGGKIAFKVAYGNGIVASATEADDALGDGRLDLSFSLLPSNEPDIYPVNSTFNTASSLGGGGAFSTLVRAGWITDVMYGNEAFAAEMEAEGIKVILGDQATAMSTTVLACADPLDGSLKDFASKQVSVSGKAVTAQTKALGFTPVAMPWNEMYEGLERGIIDCGGAGVSGMAAARLEPLAPHAILDEVSFAATPSMVGFNAALWDGLPLIAKQLLFDRLDVFLEATTISGLEGVAEVFDKYESNGGGVIPLAADARAALEDANAGLLDSLRTAEIPGVDVEQFTVAADKWTKAVTGELRYGDVDLATFIAGYADGGFDASAFVDYLYSEVLLDHRPA